MEDLIIPVGSKDPARATSSVNFACNLDKRTPEIPVGAGPQAQLDGTWAPKPLYFKAGVYIQACSKLGHDGTPNPVCARKGWADARYDAPEAYAELLIRRIDLD